MSDLISAIEKHNDKCKSLINTLDFDFLDRSKRFRLCGFRKLFKKKLIELNSSFFNQKQDLINEKEDLLGSFREKEKTFLAKKRLAEDLLKIESEAKSYFEELKLIENKIKQLPRSEKANAFEKRYFLLKKSFDECQKSLRDEFNELKEGVERIDLNKQCKINIELHEAFKCFIKQKEDVLKTIEAYQSIYQTALEKYGWAKSLLNDSHCQYYDFSKQLLKQEKSNCGNVVQSFLALFDSAREEAKTLESFIKTNDCFEEILEKSAEEAEGIKSSFKTKELDSFFETKAKLEDATNNLSQFISKNPDLYFNYLIFTKDFDGLERMNLIDYPNYLHRRDPKGNNYLHRFFELDSAFAKEYLTKTKIKAVRDMLFQANDELLCPIDLLDYADAYLFIKPGEEKRTFIYNETQNSKTNDEKKRIIHNFYEYLANQIPVSIWDSEKLRKKKEYETLSNMFGGWKCAPHEYEMVKEHYSWIVSVFLSTYKEKMNEKLSLFAKWEPYLKDVVSYDDINSQFNDYTNDSNEVGLTCVFGVLEKAFFLSPSGNVRAYFCGKKPNDGFRAEQTQENLIYLLIQIIQIENLFKNNNQCIPLFLSKTKMRFLTSCEKFYTNNPTKEMYQFLSELDHSFAEQHDMNDEFLKVLGLNGNHAKEEIKRAYYKKIIDLRIKGAGQKETEAVNHAYMELMKGSEQ